MDITVSNKPNVSINTLQSKPEVSVDKQASVKFGLTDKNVGFETQNGGNVHLSFA